MGKLHELLAVEADLEGKANRIIGETSKVFEKKPGIFMGSVRTYKPFVDDGIDYPEEHQALTETVSNKLDYTADSIIKYYDAILQKEATNQEARANLVVNGEVIGENLPATFLLGLESRLKKLRSMYEKIPTLSIGTEWVKDEGKGKGVWKIAHPEETLKRVRTIKSKVLYEATEHHPAQIDKWEESEDIGKYTKYIWSGMITPARKSELLDRIDNLIQATKKARQKANCTPIVKRNIGKKIFSYING